MCIRDRFASERLSGRDAARVDEGRLAGHRELFVHVQNPEGDFERGESSNRHENAFPRGGGKARSGGGDRVGSWENLEEAEVSLRVGAGTLWRRRSLEGHGAAGDRRAMLVDEPALNISAARLRGKRRGGQQGRRDLGEENAKRKPRHQVGFGVEMRRMPEFNDVWIVGDLIA